MEIIKQADVSLERISKIFESRSVLSKIIEVYPAVAEMNIDRDAYVDVRFQGGFSVIIWINQNAPDVLKMRLLLVEKNRIKERGGRSEWVEISCDLNQNLDCFGAISPDGLLGVTIEYQLPIKGGILDETIFLAAERLNQGALVANLAGDM